MVKRTETPSLDTITTFGYAPLEDTKEMYNISLSSTPVRDIGEERESKNAQGHMYSVGERA
jgi:hypothetical protein